MIFSSFLYGQVIGFSPLYGPVGSIVNIYGYGFSFSTTAANNIVYFGGVRATVIYNSSSQLSVTVPAGSFYTPISVTTTENNLTAYPNLPFITTYTNNAFALSATSFEKKTDFPAGVGASSVASGDFNGDGKPDLAVTNFTDNTVSVFQNTGSASSVSFASKTDFNTANTPTYVSIADMDGDGKLDMVITNSSSNTISVLRNTSTGQTISFANKLDFNTGNTPYMCTINDFDQDGKPDVAVVNRSNDNTVSILKNTSTAGSISFANKIDYATGNFPIGIASGDMNQDGKTDIAVVNYFSNTVSVYQNFSTSGNISFSVKTDYPTGAFPISVAIGDLSRDFRPDLAVANFVDNSVSILIHTPLSSAVAFSPKTDFPVGAGAGPASIAINDLDGDGNPDVATADQSDSSISVLKNISNVAIAAAVLAPKLDYATGNFPYQVAVADIDSDGRPDLITGNTNGKSVSVLRSRAGDDAPFIQSVNPIVASAGETITINGRNFSGTSSVVFGGTNAASFSIVNDSTITAILAAGASGSVAVSTTEGKAKFAGFVYNYPQGPLRIINTVAGNGFSGFGGDGGNALNANFSYPFALSTDTASGNIYITDGFNYRLRRLNAGNGIISTIAGNGISSSGGDNGLASSASIATYSGGSSVDKHGNIYLADNDRVRKIDTTTGIITTVAGGGINNYADDINALSATISPSGVALDGNDNIYISDLSRNKIRKVDAVTGMISTVAGIGDPQGLGGYNGDNIPAITARLNNPYNLAIDKSGNIFIDDLTNSRIRRIDHTTGIITTVAGNGTVGSDGDGGLGVNAQINSCFSLALDTAGNLYVPERNGSRVRKVDIATGIISTIAGNGINGYSGDGGNALYAQIRPTGIAVDKTGNIFISDVSSNVIRKISPSNSDVTACPNSSSISFSSDIFGTTYAWQQSFDNGVSFYTISPSDYGGNAGTNTPTFTIHTVSSFFNVWQYRCLVNGVPGKTFTVKIADSWNGSVSTAWENAGNWSCSVVPDYNTDVTISSGTVIVNSNVSCRSLTVKPGATVTVAPGFTLTVNH